MMIINEDLNSDKKLVFELFEEIFFQFVIFLKVFAHAQLSYV